MHPFFQYMFIMIACVSGIFAGKFAYLEGINVPEINDNIFAETIKFKARLACDDEMQYNEKNKEIRGKHLGEYDKLPPVQCARSVCYPAADGKSVECMRPNKTTFMARIN